MEELNLSTPALLFSAVSLILLAYTNRFLSYAQLVRTLKEQYVQKHSEVTAAQIDNLRRRLRNHNVSDLYRISYNSSVCIRHSTAVAYSITWYFNMGDTHIRKGT